ncbi:MAG: hypothetical protein PF961_23080 [Planctomycetota bacterium]|jgi:hypothetical protein|nr:hypothetical protein [Planctomycetota bacterium]
MSMIRTISLSCLLAGASLAAVEPELRMGPTEAVVDSEFLSNYVYEGALRTDATTWHNSGRIRYFDFGAQIDVYTALESDRARNLDSFDFVETRLRADYLFEIEGIAQILPNIRYQYFPEWDDYIDEPLWLGVEGWYLLPVEGLELGGSVNYDAMDEHGWYADFGMRQLLQMAPLDLQAWQLVTGGDSDYHRFTSGGDDSGLAALRLGAVATMPLPWEDCYATMRGELSYWLQDADRDAAPNNSEFTIGIGFEWRPEL